MAEIKSALDGKSIIDAAGGAIRKLADKGMGELLANIYDPKAESTDKRKLTIEIILSPSEERDRISLKAVKKTSVAPVGTVELLMRLEGDNPDEALISVYKPSAGLYSGDTPDMLRFEELKNG